MLLNAFKPRSASPGHAPLNVRPREWLTIRSLGWAILVALALAVVAAIRLLPVLADADDNLPGAAGDLDPSFGAGGKVATDFPHPAGANAMTIQADGKLIVAGVVQLPTGFDFGLARYNPDGSLDTSFGTGGAVATDFSGGDDRAFAVGLQPDGKIVVAGHATTASGLFDKFFNIVVF